MSSSDSESVLYERLRPDDPYFNYCHWPYEPPVSGVGKLRASSLLMRAIQDMKAADWLKETVRCIQAGIGDFRSVYGIKQSKTGWSLEIYLYDYQRENRVLSIERLEAACQGRLRLPNTVGSFIPYFMFSFDLDASVAESAGKIDTVHVYIGNPGSTVSSGISYGFTDDSAATQMENFYFFFNASSDDEIRDKIRCAAFLNSSDRLEDVIYRSELADCGTVCLANKRTSNTIYYSGINVQQLRFFLNWQQYPDDFRQFVSEHENELDHLLYDVGVDYQVGAGGVEFMKSGIYGVF